MQLSAPSGNIGLLRPFVKKFDQFLMGGVAARGRRGREKL